MIQTISHWPEGDTGISRVSSNSRNWVVLRANLKLLVFGLEFAIAVAYQTISASSVGRSHDKPHHGGSLHGGGIRQPLGPQGTMVCEPGHHKVLRQLWNGQL